MEEETSSTQSESRVGSGEKSESKSRVKLLVGATVIVVLLVLIVAALALRGTSKSTYTALPDQSNQSATSSTPSGTPSQVSSGGNAADSTGLIKAVQPLECVPKGHDYYRTEDTVAVDPTDPNIAYIGIEYKGFFKTTDGGTTWKESDTGMRAYGMEADPSKRCIAELGRTVIDPADHTHLLVSRVESPGDLNTLFSETAGVYESNDAGATWHQLLKSGMNASGSRAVAFDPKDSKTLYYGSNNMTPSYTVNGALAVNKYFNSKGILYHSADAGATWSELPTGAEHGFRAVNVGVDPADSNKLWLFSLTANTNGGAPVDSAQKSVLISTDKGATWSSLADKFPSGYRALTNGILSPTNGKNAFVITETQAGAPKSFATTDGGVTWKESNVYMFAAAYDPNDKTGGRLLGYAPYDSSPGIYESKNGGVTWSKYANLPSEVDNQANFGVRISAFAWSLSSPQVVYMDASGGLAWKSTDNGKNWKTVLTLASVGGKNKNKDGQETSREPDQSSGGTAPQPSASASTAP